MITLEEYLKHFNELIEKHPEARMMQVVYAKDEEGNGFYPVHFKPSLISYDDGDITVGGEMNAVCVN